MNKASQKFLFFVVIGSWFALHVADLDDVDYSFCVHGELIRAYVKEKGWDRTADYKKRAKQRHEAVDDQLRMDAFQKELAREVALSVDAMPDADLRKYYEEHRDQDPLFTPYGGRGAQYVEFDKSDVKDAVKRIMKARKYDELFQSTVEQLKKRHGPDIKKYCSKERVEERAKQLQEAQPGLKGILSSMVAEERSKWYEQITEGCVTEQLIRKYVREKGLDTTAEYKALEKQVHEAVDGNLRMNEFQKELAREVTAAVDAMSDADLRAYYEEHRDKDQMFKREPFIPYGSTDGKYAALDAPDVREALKVKIQWVKTGELFQAKMEELKKKYGARVDPRCAQRKTLPKPLKA